MTIDVPVVEGSADAAAPACVACGARAGVAVARVGEYSVYRCRQCSLRYVEPLSPTKAVDYDELYREGGLFDFHLRDAVQTVASAPPRLNRARREALSLLARLRPKTLLEVGCGTGLFLSYVQQLGGISCYGVDASENAITEARRHLGCALHAGPLGEGVFPGVMFDAVCSFEVIEHVPDPRAYLDAIKSRMNPGGVVILSTPNYDSRWIWQDMPLDPRSRPPVHLTFWNRESLQLALRRHGLVDVRVDRYSLPLSAGRRSGGGMGGWSAAVRALLLPSERSTLLASARRP